MADAAPLLAMANPYLDYLNAQVGVERAWPGGGYRWSNSDLWLEDRTIPHRHYRDAAVYRYAWAIPDSAAIAAIARLAPIVEMGAGTGYWAKLVAEADADVVAYDRHPPTGSAPTDEGDGPDAIAARARRVHAEWHANETAWYPVQEGEPEVLRRHRDRTLLLVWPPYGDPMAADCLRFWRGEHLVYVGEDSGGCTDDDEFHDLRTELFEVVDEVDIPRWDGMHDRMWIHRRTHRPGTPRPLP